MAIKVGGTTVVDDSRQLSNIASVDATTVAALGAAGVGAGGGTITATADGAISAGDAVALQTDGTVKSVSASTTVLNPFTENSGGSQSWSGLGVSATSNLHYLPDIDCFIQFSCTGTDIKMMVHEYTPSSESYTVKANNIFVGDNFLGDVVSAVDPVNRYFLVMWRASGSGVRYNYGYIDENNGYYSGYYLGSQATYSTASSRDRAINVAYSTTDNHFRFTVSTSSNSNICATVQISGTTNPTFTNRGYGTVKSTSQAHSGQDLTWDSTNNKFFMTERADGLNDYGYMYYFSTSTSNGAVTLHSEGYFESSSWIEHTQCQYNPSEDNFIIMYSMGSGERVRYATVVNNTITSISGYINVNGTNSFTNRKDLAYDPSSGLVAYTYFLGTTNQVYVGAIDSSGTNPTKITEALWNSSSSAGVHGITAVDEYNRVAVVRHSGTNVLYITTFDTATISSNNTNWIGFASEAISNAASGDILVVGSTDENQSSLTVGSTYYVQQDGTLGTSTANAIKAGRAIAATKLLITEGNA